MMDYKDGNLKSSILTWAIIICIGIAVLIFIL